jgi:hypothetical protein
LTSKSKRSLKWTTAEAELGKLRLVEDSEIKLKQKHFLQSLEVIGKVLLNILKYFKYFLSSQRNENKSPILFSGGGGGGYRGSSAE